MSQPQQQQQPPHPQQYQHPPQQYEHQYPQQPPPPPQYAPPPPVILAAAPPGTAMAGGLCPQCQRGVLSENFTICGIIWLIICFPLGLICFLTDKELKCGVCGFSCPKPGSC